MVRSRLKVEPTVCRCIIIGKRKERIIHVVIHAGHPANRAAKMRNVNIKKPTLYLLSSSKNLLRLSTSSIDTFERQMKELKKYKREKRRI